MNFFGSLYIEGSFMSMAEKHKYESETGTTRVRETSKGEIIIDSYIGNVQDEDNHDRFSLNATTGQVFGHGYNHEDKFDTAKGNYGKKK